jgi:hypothetical protein
MAVAGAQGQPSALNQMVTVTKAKCQASTLTLSYPERHRGGQVVATNANGAGWVMTKVATRICSDGARSATIDFAIRLGFVILSLLFIS